MDALWLEDDCLTVLEQSSFLVFSLPALNLLYPSEGCQTIKTCRRAASIGDSASSAISVGRERKESGVIKKKAAAKNKSEKENKKARNKSAKDRGRSWSGSPDWDFMEGCSYDVRPNTMSNDLSLWGKKMKPEILGEFIPLSEMSFAAMTITFDGKYNMDSARSMDLVKKESFDDVRWDAWFPWLASTSAGPNLFDTIPASISTKLSDRNDAAIISLDLHVTGGEGPSFLNRLRNEIDIEWSESRTLEYADGGRFMEVVSLQDADGSADVYSDDYCPKSTLARVFSLVVGIGAGAVFQIMK